MVDDEFTINLERRDGHVRVRITGDLDAATGPQLLEGLESRDGEARRVIVDLAQVAFIDSSGLDALMRSHAMVVASGARFEIVNPNAVVTRLFRLTGTDAMFVHETSDAADSGHH